MPTAMHLAGEPNSNLINENIERTLPSTGSYRSSHMDISSTIPEVEYREIPRPHGARPVSMMCLGDPHSPDLTNSNILNGGLNGGPSMDHLLPYTPKQNKKLDQYHRNETVRVGGTGRDKSRLNKSANSLYEPRKINDLDANNNVKKVSQSEIDIFQREISRSLQALDRLASADSNLGDEHQHRISSSDLDSNSFTIDEEETNAKLTNELASTTLANNTNCKKIEEIPQRHRQQEKQHTGSSSCSSSSSSGSENNLDTSVSRQVPEDSTKVVDAKGRVSEIPTTTDVSTGDQLSKRQEEILETPQKVPNLVIPNSSSSTPGTTPSSTPRSSLSPSNASSIIRRNTLDDQKPRERPITRSRSANSHQRSRSLKSLSTDTNGMVSVLDKTALKTVIQDVIHLILSDKTYDDKLVTRWCKDICVKVRDRLLRVNEMRHKVVVNTHIAGKVRTGDGSDSIHVATRCEANATNDRFVTVALEGEDLYVWVTVLLLHY